MFTEQVVHQVIRPPSSGGREVVEEGEALEEGEVSGIGQEFQLLVEDIIEEVELVVEEKQEKVSSQELEEKSEEQGQEHPMTGASSDQAPLEEMEALAALQVELNSVNKKDPRAYLGLQRKGHQRRKRPLNQRGAIIQGVPGFWAKAFVNHPQVTVMVSDQEEEMLSYMKHLKNEVTVKEYLISITGYQASHYTPIQGYLGFEKLLMSCERCWDLWPKEDKFNQWPVRMLHHHTHQKGPERVTPC
ncbi:testis-specific Y-encoded protein 1-like [Muntiacus reevesi]|uniref:testis-specific Y-encoded protein 1-like n=1 Tax=Muntiacus reevesi TaxID=9886 RepID=UPI003307B674